MKAAIEKKAKALPKAKNPLKSNKELVEKAGLFNAGGFTVPKQKKEWRND